MNLVFGGNTCPGNNNSRRITTRECNDEVQFIEILSVNYFVMYHIFSTVSIPR